MAIWRREMKRAKLNKGGLHKIESNHRDRLKSLQILLSRTQAGPERAVKQEKVEISRYHIQTF